MMKIILNIWYYIAKKTYRLPIVLLISLGIVMNSFIKEAPFWIPLLGTPLNDSKNGIYYFSPYIWIFINSILLYGAVDCLWTIWKFAAIHMRLKGISLCKVYTAMFILNVIISVTLVVTVLIISLILSFALGNSANSNIPDLVAMLILWILGTSFSFWMTLLIILVVKNVYIGLIGAFAMIIASGYTFPNYLWLPGTQWIYGAHIMYGGLSFMESTIYLVILIIAEFLIGYKIIRMPSVLISSE